VRENRSHGSEGGEAYAFPTPIKANPRLQLRIDASTAIVDFDASDVDAGVRVGKGPWPRTHAERLAQLSLFPVSCPAVAETLKSVEDLARIPVIVDHGSPGRWPSWLAAVGRPELRLAPGPIFSDAGLCLDAAIAGQGVALAWPTLAADALKAGLIVAPFPGRVATEESIGWSRARGGGPAPMSKGSVLGSRRR